MKLEGCGLFGKAFLVYNLSGFTAFLVFGLSGILAFLVANQ